jgi:hypothetical protein
MYINIHIWNDAHPNQALNVVAKLLFSDLFEKLSMLLLETTDMLHNEVKMKNVHDFGIRISNPSMKQW